MRRVVLNKTMLSMCAYVGRRGRRWRPVWRTLFAVLRFLSLSVAIVALSGCVFELAPLETDATGGSGGDGVGANATGGTGGVVVPDDWWDGSFVYRAQLTAQNVSGTITGATIPVFLGSEVGETAASSGADIRFVSADGTMELPHEIEQWNPSGTSVVWVRLPELSPAMNSIWMYWGNPGAPPGGAPRDVWTDFEGVFHLKDPLMVDAPVENATIDGPGVTAVNLSPSNEIAGLMGPAYRFDGINGQSVVASDSSAFVVPFGGQATIEGWYNPTPNQAQNSFLWVHEGCCLGWAVRFNASGPRPSWGAGDCCNGPGPDYYASQANAGATDGWHHFVYVVDRAASMQRLYIDAVMVAEDAILSGPDDAGQGVFRIGGDFSGGDNFFGGIDEVRFAPFGYDQARVVLHERAARNELLDQSSTESIGM